MSFSTFDILVGVFGITLISFLLCGLLCLYFRFVSVYLVLILPKMPNVPSSYI